MVEVSVVVELVVELLFLVHVKPWQRVHALTMRGRGGDLAVHIQAVGRVALVEVAVRIRQVVLFGNGG